MDFNALILTATTVGLKILGALAIWIIGRWVISLVMALTRKGMEARHVDATLITYVLASISVALNIALAIAVLGVFGIETTSFAALLAAAGIFLIILSPLRSVTSSA